MTNNYKVYMHLNKINNKKYIGLTKQKCEERWREGRGYKTQPKFFRAILIIGGIIFFINLFFNNISFSHQDVTTKSVAVSNGDTLWNIAKLEQENNSYYKGKDVRDIIQDIKNVNNLSSSNLKVNQVLEIPTF